MSTSSILNQYASIVRITGKEQRPSNKMTELHVILVVSYMYMYVCCVGTQSNARRDREPFISSVKRESCCAVGLLRWCWNFGKVERCCPAGAHEKTLFLAEKAHFKLHTSMLFFFVFFSPFIFSIVRGAAASTNDSIPGAKHCANCVVILHTAS